MAHFSASGSLEGSLYSCAVPACLDIRVVMKLVLLSVLLVILASVGNAGKRKGKGKMCGLGFVNKFKHGKLQDKDLKDFLDCLKEENRNTPPRAVKFITMKAGEPRKNCKKWIEADGCDAD